MLLKDCGRAAACAVLVCVVSSASGQEIVRGSGETEAVYAAIDMDGLSAAPRYTLGWVDTGTQQQAEADTRSQNLVLVPIPAPFLIASSGLASLVLIAAWRRHRLRAE